MFYPKSRAFSKSLWVEKAECLSSVTNIIYKVILLLCFFYFLGSPLCLLYIQVRTGWCLPDVVHTAGTGLHRLPSFKQVVQRVKKKNEKTRRKSMDDGISTVER